MAKSKQEPSKCIHYWIIESPDGRTSFGKCKYCGQINEFSNDWHDAMSIRDDKARQEEPVV